MARIFLYIVATLVGLGILGAILLAIFWNEAQLFALKRMAPDMPYAQSDIPDQPDYALPGNWAAHPGKKPVELSQPAGIKPLEAGDVDVFFIHPTTYLGKDYWSTPIDEPSALAALGRLLPVQAGPFAASARLYAPHYRQASFGAFMAGNQDTVTALLTAYFDIEMAFDQYIKHENDGRPFIIAGHSQGSLMGLWLLKNRIAGTALADQLVAAYLPGWPISLSEDLGALGDIGPCRSASETKCVVSWQTFADGGDPGYLLKTYREQLGLSGKSKAGSKMLCADPVSWAIDGASRPEAHKGAVAAPSGGSLPAPIKAMLQTSCGSDGLLYVAPPPPSPFTQFLLPGGNYHLYDIHLFYMDVRTNVVERINRWITAASSSTATQ